MKRKPRKGLCALCGNERKITREHCPPRNIFLPPRPEDTITVPVCEKCNHGSHLDDEYFRLFITSGASPGTKLWRLWEEKVVGSSFARSGGLQGRLNDRHDALMGYAKTRPLCFVNGAEVPRALLPLAYPFEAKRINAVVDKIVRCLHYHCFDDAHKGDLVISQQHGAPAVKSVNVIASGQVGSDHEFSYICEQSETGPIWYLVFYRFKAFKVISSTK